MLHKCRYPLRGSSRGTNGGWRKVQARRLWFEPLEDRRVLANWSGDVFDTMPGVSLWTNDEVQHITGNVHVPAGKTLTIEPGTVIQFNYRMKLTVDGTLDATGTSSEQIFFTSYRDNSPLGGTDNAAAGDWRALEFNVGSDASHLENVVVRYGGNGSTGEIVIASDISIVDSTVSDSNSFLVAGVRINSSNPTLTNLSFQNNYTAASMDLASSPTIHGVSASSNTINGILIDGGSLTNDVTWNTADLVYVVNGTITVPQTRTLTIGAGQVIKATNLFASASARLVVDGTLRAEGTVEEPVIFTAYRDDSVGGDTNNDGTTSGTSGSWAGLQFNPTSTANLLDHVEVRYAGATIGGAIVDNGAPLTLTNSIVRNTSFFGAGLRIISANPVVTGVTFQANENAAISADLAAQPMIRNVTMSGNNYNGMLLDAGILPVDTMWDNPDIVYIPQAGTTTVPAGITLSIAPGVIVKPINTTVKKNLLQVDGTLKAQGSAEKPIIFTAVQDASAGGSTNQAGVLSPGNGYSFLFTATSTDNVMDHVEVRYGGATGGGAIVDNGAPLILTNSIVRNTSSAGAGLRIISANPVVTGVTFRDNESAAVSADLSAQPMIRNVTMSGNKYNGMLLDAGSLPGDTTWDNPDIVYVPQAGTMTVPAGITLSIAPGVVVKPIAITTKRNVFRVEGTLKAEGSAEQPIIFTALADASAGGGTIQTGLLNGAYAFLFTVTSTGSVMDHVEVRHGTSLEFVQSTHLGTVNTDGPLTLSNSIVRNSDHVGVFVSPTGTATLTNNLIVNNASGVQAQAGSMLTAVNNTIDGNTFFGFILDSPTAILTNNLITNGLDFRGAGIRQTGPTNLTASFNNVYNPESPDYSGLASLTGTNGNISVDPKYFNAANRQYQLKPGSPVEDAGTNAGAPPTDHLGRPRFDDPNVTGRGDGSGYDIGAFEVQEVATSNVDLAATAISGPVSGIQDDLVTVNWTVTSVGSEPANGSWYDAVYLSADPVWTLDDPLLGEVKHTGDLVPNQSYDATGAFALPGVLPGDYYFLVRANSRNEVFEARELVNNVMASVSSISIDVPTLAIGTPLTGQLVETGASKVYKLVAPQGSDVRVSLDGPNGSDNQLFVKLGDVPTRQSFDHRGIAPNQTDQAVSFSSVSGGTYYVLVYAGNAPVGETFTLMAASASFSIASVFPSTGSNSGQLTLSISGFGFDINSQPRLIDSANNSIAPTQIYFTDSGKLSATFDLTGHPTGLANVQMINTGNVTTTLPQAFNIVAGQAGRLVTNVTAPSAVRVGRSYVVFVEYSNVGDADLFAPVMRLQNTGTSVLSFFPDMHDASSSVDLIGISSIGPAGVLPPGASGRIPIYVTATNLGTDIFQPVIGNYSNTSIDWTEISSIIRPDNLLDADWEPLFAQLQANIGDTWDDFHRIISTDASLMPALRGLNYSLRDVVQIEIDKAFAQAQQSVSGRLFLGDTTRPLGNVSIQIYDSASETVATAVSFSDGTFLFPFVASGTYQISVDGFVTTTTTELTVGSTDLTGVDLVVTAAATISGRVFRSTAGVPLAGVLVSANASDGSNFVATTDRSGDYSLTSLPFGVYEVRAGGETYTQAVVSNVTLVAGEVRPHLNFVIDTGAILRGTVSGPTGPISGARVVATSLDGRVFVADTDATGAYEMTEVIASTYSVSAIASGLSPGLVSNIGVATGATVSGINVLLSTAGTVEGTTTLVSNNSTVALVGIQLTGPPGTFFTQSDTNGHFSLTSVPPGSYVLSTPDGDFMNSSINVSVTAGAATVVPIPITVKGTITGRVTDSASSNGVAGVTVHARTADGTVHAAVTDTGGLYEIDGLDAATYTVILGDPGTPGIARSTATLTAAQPDSITNFTIAVAGIVSGTAFSSNGTTPVPGAFVALVQAGAVLQTMPTDSTGHFSFVVLASGDYELQAAADGLAFPIRTNVNVTGGANQTGLDFTAGTDAIQGTVLDVGTGLPIAGATVDVSRAGVGLVSFAVASLTTSADGTFLLTGVVPGSYQVTARSEGTAATRQTVTVIAGTAANTSFELGPDTTVRGIVRDDVTGLPLSDAIVTLAEVGGSTSGALALTDENGEYELSGIPAGTYDLTVLAPGHEALVMAGITTSVVDQIVNVDLNSASIHVSGTVTNGVIPLGGVNITATNAAGALLGFATTATDGTYELDTLLPGTYTVVASGAGYRDSAPQSLVVAGGADVNGLSFSLTVVAIADPESPATPGSDLGLRDTINRILIRATQRTDHPNRITDLLPFVVPGECVAQTKSALDAIRQADAELHDFQEVASMAEGLGERALETLGLVLFRSAQLGLLLVQLKTTLALYSTDLLGVAGFGVAVANGVVNYANNFIDSQLEFETNAKSGDILAAINSGNGMVGLATNINFGAAAFLVTRTSDLQATAAGATNLAVGIRSIFATVALINTSARLLVESSQDFIRIFRSFDQFNNAARLYDKSVDNAKQAIAAVEACNCNRDAAPLSGLQAAAEGTEAPAVCRKPPEPKEPLGPAIPSTPGQSPPANGAPGTQGGGTTGVPKKQSVDPNDKIGPAGFGAAGFIQSVTMPFEIEFENSAKLGATVPAQEVFVIDTLDADLDLSTLEFVSFGFNNFTFPVPPGLANYETTLDLRPDGIDLLVTVKLELDPQTRVLRATYRSLDPLTRLLPDDVDAGFLPVNDETKHNGEGYFTYIVRPKLGMSSGTQITNQAAIIFDVNPEILTPTTLHTLDMGDPASGVAALSATSPLGFSVEWSGGDDLGGSGIASFDIFVSDNGSPFLLWLDDTTAMSELFEGVVNHSYAFYSIAKDNVGHLEQKTPVAEAETMIVAGPPWQNVVEPTDVDRDGFVVPLDVLIVVNELNDPKFSDRDTRKLKVRIGTETFFFDVNGDDFVSPVDALIIVNSLNSPAAQGESEAVSLPDLSQGPASWLNSSGDRLSSTPFHAPPRTSSQAPDRPPFRQFDSWYLSSDTTKTSRSAAGSQPPRDVPIESALVEEWDLLLSDLATDVLNSVSRLAQKA